MNGNIYMYIYISITTTCTALPACHLSCMSNKLIFLIYTIRALLASSINAISITPG
jgi:hypothetical protein